ncbi:MAG TPA: DUF6113 family protein [Candidatus Nanopelagicales bacterium]
MRVTASALLGLVLGVLGALVQWWSPALGSVGLPVGAVLVVVVVALVARACAWWQGSRLGAVAVSVGWLVSTLVMATTSRSGDLVLSSGVQQEAYLIGGAMVLAACCGFPLLPEDDALATAATGPAGPTGSHGSGHG